MFVIIFYIDVDEETRIIHSVYGIYNSKEQALESINNINNFLKENYFDDIIDSWKFEDGLTIDVEYTEPEDDFNQYAGLSYEIKEISTQDSILNITPDNIGTIIYKLRSC